VDSCITFVNHRTKRLSHTCHLRTNTTHQGITHFSCRRATSYLTSPLPDYVHKIHTSSIHRSTHHPQAFLGYNWQAHKNVFTPTPTTTTTTTTTTTYFPRLPTRLPCPRHPQVPPRIPTTGSRPRRSPAALSTNIRPPARPSTTVRPPALSRAVRGDLTSTCLCPGQGRTTPATSTRLRTWIRASAEFRRSLGAEHPSTDQRSKRSNRASERGAESGDWCAEEGCGGGV
jgi:hypothetical protein